MLEAIFTNDLCRIGSGASYMCGFTRVGHSGRLSDVFSHGVASAQEKSAAGIMVFCLQRIKAAVVA